MVITASFTIAKTWKQPDCPSTDEEDAAHTHYGALLSHEENEISEIPYNTGNVANILQ